MIEEEEREEDWRVQNCKSYKGSPTGVFFDLRMVCGAIAGPLVENSNFTTNFDFIVTRKIVKKVLLNYLSCSMKMI